MKFLSEPVPDRAVATEVAPGVRRLVADNPGPMTYHGTNTYLLDWEDGVAVVDPGPDDAAHVGRILALAGGPVRAILLTHGHLDHVGALAELRAATGAVVQPDGALRAVPTPGHAADHLCFVLPDGTVFSGDVVMGWSTTVVDDMAAYFASLERLLGMKLGTMLPGHGPPIVESAEYVRALLDHRSAREAAIMAALGADPVELAGLTGAIYPGLDRSLVAAAQRSVQAHLDKLEAEGRAMPSAAGWRRVG